MAEALKIVADLIDPYAWKAKREAVRHTNITNTQDEQHRAVDFQFQEERAKTESDLAKIKTANALLDLMIKAKENGVSNQEIDILKTILIRESEKLTTPNVSIRQMNEEKPE